jgi:hypothetical protein
MKTTLQDNYFLKNVSYDKNQPYNTVFSQKRKF